MVLKWQNSTNLAQSFESKLLTNNTNLLILVDNDVDSIR